jgi:hypothetical protein
MLVICCLILAAAPLLKVLPDERVAIRGTEARLPPSCPSKVIFHFDCPGCGLTRSFVHIAHGDWESSLRVNRVGWLIMLAASLQIPYRLHALYGSGRFVLGRSASSWFGIAVIVVLFGSWFIGLLEASFG